MADKTKKSGKSGKSGKPGLGARLRKYFRDTASEFKKIVWPTRKQVRNNVVVVLVTMLVFAAIIWALDYGLGALRTLGIDKLTEMASGGA